VYASPKREGSASHGYSWPISKVAGRVGFVVGLAVGDVVGLAEEVVTGLAEEAVTGFVVGFVVGLVEDGVIGRGIVFSLRTSGFTFGVLCAGVVDEDGATLVGGVEVLVVLIPLKFVSRFAERSVEHAERVGISKSVSRDANRRLLNSISCLHWSSLVVFV
jgi:hypothetical protein